MVFRAITHGVEVTAEPEFSVERSDPDENRYFWTYTITLRNRNGETVQLIDRHWEIVDETGARQVVDGPGVVGEQPSSRLASNSATQAAFRCSRRRA